MKKFVGAALAAGAMVAMSGAAANAASQAPQTVTLTNNSGGAPTVHLNIVGSFADQYNFTTTTAMKLMIASSVTSVLLGDATISNFVATLYEKMGNAYTKVAQGTKYMTAVNGDTSSFTYDATKAGMFRLIVSGTANKAGNFKANYAGAITVAPVPLPNSVAMLGVAVLGLGIAGAVRRKSAKSASAAV